MTTLFLGVEILSIPMYVLSASRKRDLASNEAGFKYLIMGSFASGFLLHIFKKTCNNANDSGNFYNCNK